MWLMFRLSALIQAILRKYYINCLSIVPLFNGSEVIRWLFPISWPGVTCSIVISRHIKQVKSLKLIPSVEFAFHSSLCCPKRSWCKWRRLSLGWKKLNKPIWQMETLRAAKSTIWFILKKNKCIGELSNNQQQRPGRPGKTTRVDDHRIFSLVKKKPSQHLQGQENSRYVGMSMSKSTIKRCLRELLSSCWYLGAREATYSWQNNPCGGTDGALIQKS